MPILYISYNFLFAINKSVCFLQFFILLKLQFNHNTKTISHFMKIFTILYRMSFQPSFIFYVSVNCVIANISETIITELILRIQKPCQFWM